MQTTGGWVGNGTGTATLKAVAGHFDDATRWDATLVPVGSGLYEPRGFGDRFGASAARHPNTGIFAKSHVAFASFEHVALRIVPRSQWRWLSQLSAETDDFDNRYLTIGAGKVGGGVCTGGTLVSEVNRPTDLTDPNIQLERLAYDVTQEDALIELLLLRDSRYADNLDYDCNPANDGTLRYNSNSYAAGLLNAVVIPYPGFVSKRLSNYPGWWKPVPVVHFGPQ